MTDTAITSSTDAPMRTGTVSTAANDRPSMDDVTVRTLGWLRMLFRASLHLLVVGASLMLAWAEGTWNPVAFTVPLAFVAFVLTGHRNAVHLPNVLANVAGAVAIFACYSEFSRGDQEARLLSGAHLLVYLMWIVLFQKKTIGTYWWIIALTMLQIAVGSLLRSNADYGLALVGYALATMWTLSVFSVYRAYAAAYGEDGDVIRESPTAAPPSPFAALRASSVAVPAVHLDERPGVLGLRFATGVVGLTFGALAISFLVFLYFPRVWIGQQAFQRFAHLAEDAPGGVKLTGFSDSVKLGDVGTILESNERVFEVRMEDVDTGKPVDVQQYALSLGYDEPLFRGKVLDVYSGGEWSEHEWAKRPIQTSVFPQRGVIRQTYRLSPNGSNVLFAMQPVRTVYSIDDAGEYPALRGTYTTEYSRSRRRRRETVDYAAYSFPRRRRGDVRDVRLRPVHRVMQLHDLTTPVKRESLPLVEEFVAEERAALRSGRATSREVAEGLVRRLRDSGEFSYSLTDSGVPRGTDPIEHFLSTTKSGHCEYFASALAILLRRAGIPARVVIGFKGGAVNRYSGYFEVEQRHAHAWVEAYLTDVAIDFDNRAFFRDAEWFRRTLEGEVSDAEWDRRVARYGADVFRWARSSNLHGGEWVVLDATPGDARSASVAEQARSITSFGDLMRLLSDQWDWYILRMNVLKQYDQFYKPLTDIGRDLVNVVRGDERSQRSLRERIAAIASSPTSWFSPAGFVVTFLLLGTLYGCWRVLRWVMGWVIETAGADRSAKGDVDAIRVAFYERFAEACARLGMERAASQTAREFAGAVRERLARLRTAGEGGLDEFEGLPDDVVDDFYAIRFGGLAPSADRLAELEVALTEFETAIANAERHAPNAA